MKGAPPGHPAPDPAFPLLKRQIIERTGHTYYEDKDAALWERVQRRIRATGAGSCEGYFSLLAGSQEEWVVLESEITIGETYFFRDTGQFDALRDTILPSLVARRAGQRRLRIWSAGCSTGAEPYSVAILLQQLLGAHHRSWSITILGTDISEAALTTARQARFSPWALRGMDPAERARSFLPVEGGAAWQLRPEHRNTVCFERQNLLGLLDGSLPLGMTEFDLILCRNVLIYFDRALVPRLVRALGDRLAPDGWLLLGHSEPDPSFNQFLRPVALPGTAAWRPMLPVQDSGKVTEAPDDACSAFPPAQAVPPDMPVVSSYPDRYFAAFAPAPVLSPIATVPLPRAIPPAPPQAALPEPDPPNPAPDLRTLVDRARDQADSGAMAAARETLRDALRAYPTTAALHHLDGLVSRALGEPAAAEAALRRALYLDKGFVAAHYQLGLLLLERGAAEAGRRCIANAARLARALPDTALLEEGDGMTADTLLGLARYHLAERDSAR
jgi:chemotaxis protein methyltransferase CheR